MTSLYFKPLAQRVRNGRLLATIFALVLSLQLCAESSYGGYAALERRIRFRRGQTEAQVKGRLNGMADKALFVLRARKGQHMRVEIKGQGATRGWVISPSGEEEGAPGGVIFDNELRETGDYRIRVRESQMAEAWKGTFILRVTITG